MRNQYIYRSAWSKKIWQTSCALDLNKSVRNSVLHLKTAAVAISQTLSATAFSPTCYVKVFVGKKRQFSQFRHVQK